MSETRPTYLPADIENWRESVQRDADRLRATIESNAQRLEPDQVEVAKTFIGRALKAVCCEEKASA